MVWRTHSLACAGRLTAALPLFLAWSFWPSPALAYRPFDGTDAAVADLGELEVELQPVGALWEQSQTTLTFPEAVHFGFKQNWEATLEGKLETPLSPAESTRLTDADVLLKDVLRPGSLQDKEGPSIATEFGVLLPDSSGASGVGARIAGIASQRWDWGTIHLNAETALMRDQHADLFFSTIIEGPFKWKVRPVAEVFYEDEIGKSQTISGLVGAIWQVRDSLSFDAAFRRAFTNDHPVTELRAGLTVGFNTGFFGGRVTR
jgi:hypothetical protein